MIEGLIVFLCLAGLGWKCWDLKQRLTLALDKAHLDELTGLVRRSGLISKFGERNGQLKDLAIIYVDLANLKTVNDGLGHATGDLLIKAAAKGLKRGAPKDALIARIGGDEFCIVLSKQDHVDGAQKIANRVSSAVETPVETPHGSVNLSCHIGLAFGNSQDEDLLQVLNRADQAMYFAKSNGRRVKIYDEALRDRLAGVQLAKSELEQAFRNDELKLFFQPKFDARSRRLVGAEALIRWPGKLGPAGSPAVFIPIAEESGLIIPLGEWILDQAVEAVKALGNIPVAVNVSALQLSDAGFAARVVDRLIEGGLHPSLLEIEITETALISRPTEAKQAIRQLRDFGVRVFLDDFGTGYSSLSYLRIYRFDGIKIDRSFLREIDESAVASDLLKMTIQLGHVLNMEVVAEGLESEAHCAALDAMGCDVLQGFALGIPGPLEELYALHQSEAA